MKSYSEFLLEKLSKRDCEAKFEKIIFGDFREKGEEDTKAEEDIFDQLYNFVSSNDYHTTKTSKVFNHLKDCKTYYKQVLSPPSGYAYRKTYVNFSDINSGTWSKNKDKTFFDSFTWSKKYTYTSKRKVQSWTVKLDVAEEFESGRNPKRGQIPAILKIKIGPEFIMNPKFMNDVDFDSGIDDEYEIIRVSDKAVKTELIVLAGDYTPLAGKIK